MIPSRLFGIFRRLHFATIERLDHALEVFESKAAHLANPSVSGAFLVLAIYASLVDPGER